jgi:hypothetical protein
MLYQKANMQLTIHDNKHTTDKMSKTIRADAAAGAGGGVNLSPWLQSGVASSYKYEM